MIQPELGSRTRPDGEEPRDDQRAAGDAGEERHAVLRALVPQVAHVRGHPPRRLHRLRHLQPHVPARVLRRPRGGVLRAEQRRHAVGRGRGAHRRGQRTRRGQADRLDHVPGPHEVRGGPGQVHARHGPRRRHRERPRPAAHRGEQVVDAARRLRRRAVRPGRAGELGTRRRGHASRRPPRAGAGPQGDQDAAEAGGRRDPRPEVLLVRLLRHRGTSGSPSAARAGPPSRGSRSTCWTAAAATSCGTPS